MGVSIQREEGRDAQCYTVKRRRVNTEGTPVGTANNNPILDTRQYECESPSGDLEYFAANVLAKNLLAQVDEEGHRQMMLDEITNHQTTRYLPAKGHTHDWLWSTTEEIHHSRMGAL